jgi:hypothetical protein
MRAREFRTKEPKIPIPSKSSGRLDAVAELSSEKEKLLNVK